MPFLQSIMARLTEPFRIPRRALLSPPHHSILAQVQPRFASAQGSGDQYQAIWVWLATPWGQKNLQPKGGKPRTESSVPCPPGTLNPRSRLYVFVVYVHEQSNRRARRKCQQWPARASISARCALVPLPSDPYLPYAVSPWRNLSRTCRVPMPTVELPNVAKSGDQIDKMIR